MSFASSKRRRPGNAGVTSLEVAVIFGIFIILVFGIIDMSRYLYSQQALTTLVTATARQGYATGSNYNPQGQQVQALVAAYAPLLDGTQVTISVSVNQPAGDFVTIPFAAVEMQVIATYNFTPITPLVSALLGGGTTMTATVTYTY